MSLLYVFPQICKTFISATVFTNHAFRFKLRQSTYSRNGKNQKKISKLFDWKKAPVNFDLCTYISQWKQI